MAKEQEIFEALLVDVDEMSGVNWNALVSGSLAESTISDRNGMKITFFSAALLRGRVDLLANLTADQIQTLSANGTEDGIDTLSVLVDVGCVFGQLDLLKEAICLLIAHGANLDAAISFAAPEVSDVSNLRSLVEFDCPKLAAHAEFSGASAATTVMAHEEVPGVASAAASGTSMMHTADLL